MAEYTPLEQSELDRLCQEVRSLLCAAEQDACSRRFAAAQRIAAIQDDARLGSAAVKSMAAKLGMGASSLFRYARVARRLSELEIRNFGERAKRAQAPFSWSHIEALATVKEEGVRERLIQETLHAHESVRDFARRVKAADPRPNPQASSSAADSVLKRIAKLRREAEKCAALLRDHLADIREGERGAASSELSALKATLVGMEALVFGPSRRSPASPPLPFTPTTPSWTAAQPPAPGAPVLSSPSISLPFAPAPSPRPTPAPVADSTPQRLPVPFTPAPQPTPNPASLPPPWLNINP